MLIIDIKVVPGSGKCGCKFNKNGAIVCYLKSPPERGQANAELIKFLAKKLQITQQEITIVGGATARTKRLRIAADISREQFLQAMDMYEQLNCI